MYLTINRDDETFAPAFPGYSSGDAVLRGGAIFARAGVVPEDAALLNAGGIVAFYPTKVPLHQRAKSLGDRDLFGDFANAAKAPGIRMVSGRAVGGQGSYAGAGHRRWAGGAFRLGDGARFAVHILNYTNPNFAKGWFRETYPLGPQTVRMELAEDVKVKRVQVLRSGAELTYKGERKGAGVYGAGCPRL